MDMTNQIIIDKLAAGNWNDIVQHYYVAPDQSVTNLQLKHY